MPAIPGMMHTHVLSPVALTREGVDLLACDATLRSVIVHDGTIIGAGRTTDTISAELRAVLIARDRGCRFPRCTRPVTDCVAHHAIYWRHGGHTDPDNLVLLCRAHHRHVHYHNWAITIHPDTTTEFTYKRRTHTTIVAPNVTMTQPPPDPTHGPTHRPTPAHRPAGPTYSPVPGPTHRPVPGPEHGSPPTPTSTSGPPTSQQPVEIPNRPAR